MSQAIVALSRSAPQTGGAGRLRRGTPQLRGCLERFSFGLLADDAAVRADPGEISENRTACSSPDNGLRRRHPPVDLYGRDTLIR
jgi:hypothetical protein